MIEITDKQLCCGCSACVSICPKNCISFAEDEEGFLYPKVDKTNCINCNLCESVCQFVRTSDKHIPKKVYAAKNLNEQERLNSSSGGIFILLAREFISKGGVVFGVKFDENFDAIHTYAESFDELKAFQGSKYVQSRIGNAYLQVRDFLKEGRNVLFSGTGCQILGLKKFLQKDYDNLFTVEIVCHGVPSPKIWKDYLNGLGLVDINEFSFRNKSNGWKNYYLEAKNNKNTIIFRDSFKTNIYIKGFLNNLFLRPSCFNCVARQKSGSDIILGDFWGISNFLPEFDDDKGVSLVLINSSKAEEVYNSLQVESIETKYEYALKGNPLLEISVKKTKKRNKFWCYYSKQNLNNAIKKVCKGGTCVFFKRVIRWSTNRLKSFFSKIY